MADGNSSDPRTWAKRDEVAKRLGVSVGKVRKLEMQGRLAGELVDGVWRFSDEAIEDAKDDASRDDDATLANVLAALSGALRQVFQHNERLFELVNKQQEIAVPQWAAMLTEERSENEKLRARDREMVAQREELES
jgi:DNA-binding transcriptional MerR regulator